MKKVKVHYHNAGSGTGYWVVLYNYSIVAKGNIREVEKWLKDNQGGYYE